MSPKRRRLSLPPLPQAGVTSSRRCRLVYIYIPSDNGRSVYRSADGLVCTARYEQYCSKLYTLLMSHAGAVTMILW